MESKQSPVQVDGSKIPEALAQRLGAAAWQAAMAAQAKQKGEEGHGSL